MVAPGSFQVPLTQQDLPPDVTYRQIIESLGALQQASDDVFSRIEDCVAERRERLEKLLQRLKNVESKIDGLFSGGQSLAAQASALYPELNALRRWHPIFSEAAQQGSRGKPISWASLPLPPAPSAPDSNRVRGHDTADLYHFFKQAQASSVTLSTQGGPTSIPKNLRSATSLLRHGTDQMAFMSAEQDMAGPSRPLQSSSLTLHKQAVGSRRLGQTARPGPVSRPPIPHNPPAFSPSGDLDETLAAFLRSTLGDLDHPPPASLRPPWPGAAARSPAPANPTSERGGLFQSKGMKHSGGSMNPPVGSPKKPGKDAERAEQSAQQGPSAEAQKEAGQSQEDPSIARSGLGASNSRDRAASALDGGGKGQGPGEAVEGTSSQPAPERSLAASEQGQESRSHDPFAGAGDAPRLTEALKAGTPQGQREKGSLSAGTAQASSSGAAVKPPRSQPPSRIGSSETLEQDPRQVGLVPNVARLRAPSPTTEDGSALGSDGSLRHVGDLAGSALDKQVDLGALGHMPTDLEHSIMLRQRSLSSRASAEDVMSSEQPSRYSERGSYITSFPAT